jgi:hypothetical protein
MASAHEMGRQPDRSVTPRRPIGIAPERPVEMSNPLGR